MVCVKKMLGSASELFFNSENICLFINHPLCVNVCDASKNHTNLFVNDRK